jgi:O-antigen/teichoic acid export membrane protein
VTGTPDAPFRSQGVASGFAAGIASRALRFLTNLLLARAIILQFGAGRWGILALSWAVTDLVFLGDFAILEVALYQAAAAENRSAARRALDQVLLLAVLPAILGTAALLACSAAARAGFVFRADYAGATLSGLFLAAAVSYPVLIATKVYVGTLQGLGWVRELNLWALGALLLDFCVVMGGLRLGLDVVTIQWGRALLAPVALLLLIGTLRVLRLPVAAPGRPDRKTLRPLLRYAVSYNVNRGLGAAVASVNAPIAQFFVPAASLGTFGAADQWASKVRKFTDVAWESFYHRFVHCFRAEASPAEREAGRLQFLAVSLAINLLLVPGGVALVLASPWIFRAWLNARAAALPLALLPGLVLAWTLNASCAPLTWVLLAANRFRASARLHLVVVAANVALTVALTSTRGIEGTVEAMVASGLMLTTLLSVAACRVVGTSWPRWAASNAAPYAVAAAAIAWSRTSSSPWTPAAAIALSAAASIAIGLRARSFRAVRDMLRSPAGAP